jgi:hypothetical protein
MRHCIPDAPFLDILAYIIKVFSAIGLIVGVPLFLYFLYIVFRK